MHLVSRINLLGLPLSISHIIREGEQCDIIKSLNQKLIARITRIRITRIMDIIIVTKMLS